jgi:UPF0755 protein
MTDEVIGERVRLTRRGKLVVALSMLGLLIAMPAAGGWFYLRSIGFIGPSHPGASVEVVIPEGSGAADIAKLLEDAGVIKSSLGFRLVAYFNDGSRSIQAGRYELPVGLSAHDALDALKGGPVLDFVMVTFPEGSWLTDFASILESETHISGQRFLKLATSGRALSELAPPGVETAEGLLFPSTYQVIDEDTAETVLARLLEEFESQVGTVDFSVIEDDGYSRYEAVIVASMIEAEAAVDEERAKIARVIYNRLEAGMPLQIDATVFYALGEHKPELTASDLQVNSPYNTRLVTGLPPTPIGASGLASLEASAHPASGGWIYYVLADCEGHHAFSTNYDDFLEDKARYKQLSCG